MTVRDARRLAACLTLVLAMTSGSSRARSLQIAPAPNEIAGRPIVYSAVVDGIIHPVSAEYMIDTLERADLAGAALVVFTLRTPGGLLDSTRAIVSSMIAARTPVAIFVVSVRRPRGLGGFHPHDRRGRRRHVAGHAHRRGPSRRGRRREDG